MRKGRRTLSGAWEGLPLLRPRKKVEHELDGQRRPISESGLRWKMSYFLGVMRIQFGGGSQSCLKKTEIGRWGLLGWTMPRLNSEALGAAAKEGEQFTHMLLIIVEELCV